MRSIREILKKAADKLIESRNTNTPVLDAELLLLHVLRQSGMEFDRIKLLTQSGYLVDERAAGKYMSLIDERSKGKPVQYITQKQEFMGFELFVRRFSDTWADTETVVKRFLRRLPE